MHLDLSMIWFFFSFLFIFSLNAFLREREAPLGVRPLIRASRLGIKVAIWYEQHHRYKIHSSFESYQHENLKNKKENSNLALSFFLIEIWEWEYFLIELWADFRFSILKGFWNLLILAVKNRTNRWGDSLHVGRSSKKEKLERKWQFTMSSRAECSISSWI